MQPSNESSAATRRLRVTWVGEYLANPRDYPDCDGDPVKMAALDQQALDEGDLGLMDMVESAETVETRVEVAR